MSTCIVEYGELYYYDSDVALSKKQTPTGIQCNAACSAVTSQAVWGRHYCTGD